MNAKLEEEYAVKIVDLLRSFHKSNWSVEFPNHSDEQLVQGSVDMGHEVRHFAVTSEEVTVKVGPTQLTYYMLANLYYNITEYVNLFNNQTEEE